MFSKSLTVFAYCVKITLQKIDISQCRFQNKFNVLLSQKLLPDMLHVNFFEEHKYQELFRQ